MNILYGIQGTGNGHVARSRVMAKYFAESGARVTYLFSGREKNQYYEMDVFADFLVREGLTFISEGGKIDYLKTALKNNIWHFIKDVFSLDLSHYDLIITDFEPITAWAAKLRNKPVIGLGHQYAFGPNTPLAAEGWLAKWVLRNFAPVQHGIGLHWHPYQENVLPPIIDINLAAGATQNFITVYLPFEDQLQVTELLNSFSDYHFMLYAPQLTEAQHGNVLWQKTSYQGFKENLTHTRGVICNAGFELISECLHLGKPILTKPIRGQMEQQSNALVLKQLQLADVMQSLDEEIIARWLEMLDDDIHHQPQPIPDVAKDLVDLILAKKWGETCELSKELWKRAIFKYS
ncbi:MJ1255/VC2487 family glycosyltransferase [Psychromonas sp.]|uniref:MJ1255/VC2487 family glycosyltransferase n=1 Tax=Psychromonas sp. TaxID=1884585 RepID=UPI00356A9EE3